MNVVQDGVFTERRAAALVLASASPLRLALLRQIGVEPQHLHASNIDERPKRGEYPRSLAKRLAQAKAKYAGQATRDIPGLEKALILAADTVVSVGGTILPKPESKDEAYQCLRILSGRTHKVFTSICLISATGRLYHRLVKTRLRFAFLTHQVINTYVASEEWRGQAGGYAIHGRAGAFVVCLSGSYSAVIGLDLAETFHLLQAQDYPFYEG